MIPLCLSPVVGSDCVACGIYAVASDKLITGNFLKRCTQASHAQTHQRISLIAPSGTGFFPHWVLIVLCLPPSTHRRTPLPRCAPITRGMTHLSEFFKGFLFCFLHASHPDNPFLSVMLQHRFLTARGLLRRGRLWEWLCRGSWGEGGFP